MGPTTAAMLVFSAKFGNLASRKHLSFGGPLDFCRLILSTTDQDPVLDKIHLQKMGAPKGEDPGQTAKKLSQNVRRTGNLESRRSQTQEKKNRKMPQGERRSREKQRRTHRNTQTSPRDKQRTQKHEELTTP